MNLPRWIATVFQAHRPASSHLHLLNESQPLRNLQPPNLAGLTGPGPMAADGLNALFQETISSLGGKESVLLVGETGYSPQSDGGNCGILEELSFALFQSPDKRYVQRQEERVLAGPNKVLSCVTSNSPSQSRTLEFPVILAVFRETLVMEAAKRTLVKEILRDVKVRTRTSAVVGIIYSRELLEKQKSVESKERLRKLMGQVFTGQLWGVCCYSGSQPKSIREVKLTIIATLEGRNRDQHEYTEDQMMELDTSFRDLICRLGGKERFLLLGNICPSVRPSEKTGIFNEVTKALFDDLYETLDEEVTTNLRRDMRPSECIQLPQPKSFPYPLILVAFRSTFLREDVNRAQVKEILADVKARVKMSSTCVISVVYSHVPLELSEELEFHFLLQKILCKTFSCPVGVCSFVRTNPESAEEVKRCVCHVLKQRN